MPGSTKKKTFGPPRPPHEVNPQFVAVHRQFAELQAARLVRAEKVSAATFAGGYKRGKGLQLAVLVGVPCLLFLGLLAWGEQANSHWQDLSRGVLPVPAPVVVSNLIAPGRSPEPYGVITATLVPVVTIQPTTTKKGK